MADIARHVSRGHGITFPLDTQLTWALIWTKFANSQVIQAIRKACKVLHHGVGAR